MSSLDMTETISGKEAHLVLPDPAERSSFLLVSVRQTSSSLDGSPPDMNWRKVRVRAFSSSTSSWKTDQPQVSEVTWEYMLTTVVQGGSLVELASRILSFLRVGSSSMVGWRLLAHQTFTQSISPSHRI